MSISNTISLFESGPACVGVIGQGYVGLPLALLFAEAGLQTIGFDIDQAKVRELNGGHSFIQYIGADRIQKALSSGKYVASNDFTRMKDCDALIICVPTPLDSHLQPDISYIKQTASEIAIHLRRGQLVVLQSTTYPGCTREDVLPILEATGLRLDEDFCLAFSPEREDPANKSYHTGNIPKVVGGITELSTRLACAVYSRALEKIVPVSSAEVAESAKLLENIFRCVNIAMVNELKIIFEKLGIDVWEVIGAASTKPFGFMPFHPGPGLGGHCIPIDPFYLSWKARAHDQDTRFIELAGQINRHMPHYVVQRLVEALNAKGKSLKNSLILILGFSYKKNLGDDRESPAYTIYEELAKFGARIDYHDPYLPSIRPTREHHLSMQSIQLAPEKIKQFDAVVIVTDHDDVDYQMLLDHADLIVDTRNVFKASHPKVVRA